jgi:hypothetical protein
MRKKEYDKSGEEPNPLSFLRDACAAYWSKKMEWNCSIFELDAPLPPCVKYIATKAISAICDDVVDRKLPFIERKPEINNTAYCEESYKTPEPKSARRDLKKEARDLEILTQLESDEECLTSKGGSPDSDSDKTLDMEDVSTDGEDICSPTQATQEDELISDLAEAKASEPKVAVITPKFSSKAKNPPPMKSAGKMVPKPLKKRRRIEVSQSTITQFSQFIQYGEDPEVEEL